jgi:hypothetical protein
MQFIFFLEGLNNNSLLKSQTKNKKNFLGPRLFDFSNDSYDFTVNLI